MNLPSLDVPSRPWRTLSAFLDGLYPVPPTPSYLRPSASPVSLGLPEESPGTGRPVVVAGSRDTVFLSYGAWLNSVFCASNDPMVPPHPGKNDENLTPVNHCLCRECR